MSGEIRLSPRLLARVGGILYLMIILGAVFFPFAIAPSGMMQGDAALPSPARILAAKPLYVFAGAAQLVLAVCDIAVAVVLYALLRPVDRTLALLATAFRIAFAAVVTANVVNHFAPLVMLDGMPDSGFTAGQVQALATAFLKLRTLGLDVALVLFGFHCLIAGYLISRSSFLPRVLGFLLTIGGVGYIANILASFLPHEVATQFFPYIMWPAGVAELGLTAWLIVIGVNSAKWQAQAGKAAAS